MKRAALIFASLVIPFLIPKVAAAQQAPLPLDYIAPEVLLRRGANVFAANCTSYCHGNGGTAGQGAPALANRGFDAQYILNTIMYGLPGTAMQAWGQKIPKDDSAAVIAYVKSLNGIALTANAAPPPPLTPEAEQGRVLFFDAGGDLKRCSNCHQMAGKGIAVAPIVNIPADVAGLRNLQTPTVSTATVGGQSFPAFVVAQLRDQTKLFDLTTLPAVVRPFPKGAVSLADHSSWQHSSVLGSYSEDELKSILVFMQAVKSH